MLPAWREGYRAVGALTPPPRLPLPQWIRPQLTELVDVAPDGPQWLHEIKFGYLHRPNPRATWARSPRPWVACMRSTRWARNFCVSAP
jgi:hypothetical protein